MRVVSKRSGRQRKLWRSAGLFLFLLLALTFSLPAAAQAPAPVLKTANLRLLPEYDDPGLLVIVNGTVDGTVTYPLQITIPVPANARGLQATEQDSTGALFNRAWQRNGDKITYSLENQPSFQVEYYLDRPPSGNDRVVKYNWVAPYATKELIATVEQPARATNFAVTPKPDTSFQAPDGLTTHQVKYTDVAAGTPLDFSVSYTKADSAPSFSASQPAGNTSGAQSQAPAAAEPAAPPAAQSLPIVPLALIVLGVGALVGALVYYLLERRRQTPAVSPRSVRAAARPAGAAFCRQCGRPLAPGDRFCGNCGTQRSA